MEKSVSEFSIQDLAPLALGFVVAAVIISYGATVLSNVQSQQTANTYAYNVSQKGQVALGTFGDNLPLMATVIVAAVIIGILVVYLGGRAMGR